MKEYEIEISRSQRNLDMDLPGDLVFGVPGPEGDQGPPGKDGRDGVSVTHSWNGTILTITSASGTSSANLIGKPGKDGGLSKEAAALLIIILQKALFANDQSSNIQKLSEMLGIDNDDDGDDKDNLATTSALGLARLGSVRLGTPYHT